MSKSFKVICTKNSTSDEWPGMEVIGPETIELGISKLIELGIQQYMSPTMLELVIESARLRAIPDFNALNRLEIHYFCSSNDSFDENKDIILQYVPVWRHAFVDEDLKEFYRANNINITIEEVSDPELIGFSSAKALSSLHDPKTTSLADLRKLYDNAVR